MDGFIVWTGTELRAGDERTDKYLRGKAGQVLTITIHPEKSSRDPVRHNQFFAVLSRCVLSMDYELKNNVDIDMAVDDLLVKLKYAVGFTETVTGIDGIDREIPRSISFSDCTEAEADNFRQAAYIILCQILGCSRKELFDL